ncbi:MAG TPA: 50S ribosomal protein L3 [Clostridiales bacterium]|jgi:large subunit ribosomal protein L3|nr:50S ribosomal protein L3 [Clostridiales bacterium]
MKKGLIGKKIGMTQVFDETGKVIPVTVLEMGPCTVTQLKTAENDGYEAAQLGFGEIAPNHVNKPYAGHFKKNDIIPKRYLREFKFENISEYELGAVIKVDVFNVGEKIDAHGTSKGKGTAGVIKRWNFSRLKESHGSGPVVRRGGSTGACADPARIFKGKKLAGHLGSEKVTVQNLEIVKIDAENNLIAVKGAVPGPKQGVVVITDAVKA